MWTAIAAFYAGSAPAIGAIFMALVDTQTGVIDATIRNYQSGSNGLLITSNASGSYVATFSDMPSGTPSNGVELMFYTGTISTNNVSGWLATAVFDELDEQRANLANLDGKVSLVPAGVWNILQSAIAAGATMGQWLLSLIGVGTGQNVMVVALVDSVSSAAIVGGSVAITGAASAGATSDGSGHAAINLNSGSYAVSAIASGYENYVPSAQVVNGSGKWVSSGTATLTVPMMAITLPYTPPSGQIWGLLTTCDQHGTAMAGIKIQLAMTAGPDGATAGLTFPTDFATYMSDGSGHIAVLLPMGATFAGLTSKGKPVSIDVPTSGTSFSMPRILGQYG